MDALLKARERDRDQVMSGAAALLRKLDWVDGENQAPPSRQSVLSTPRSKSSYVPGSAAQNKSADEDAERAAATLSAAVLDLEAQIAAEESELEALLSDEQQLVQTLEGVESERIELETELLQQRRVEFRQQASAKLLQLQLTVATQLYGVAESLSHVAAAPSVPQSNKRTSNAKQLTDKSGSASSGEEAKSGWGADQLRHKEREVEELRRALKRQQHLVDDAHRQLLELTVGKRGKPLGAAGAVDLAGTDLGALRASLAEQEMRRLMAEARADELQAQVRLFEEQGLRLRLHPPPMPPSHHDGVTFDRVDQVGVAFTPGLE